MSASKQVESVLRLRVKSSDARLIDSAVRQIVEAIERYGGAVVGPIPLPTAVRRDTVKRSPFVHKKSREPVEMKVHKRLVEVPKPDQKIVEALGSLNLPAGIDVEVKMV